MAQGHAHSAHHRRGAAAVAAAALVLTLGSSCKEEAPTQGVTPEGGRERATSASQKAQGAPSPVYTGGLSDGWEDWGWTEREIGEGKPARLDLSDYGGWILAHPSAPLAANALRFSFRDAEEPRDQSPFLEVRLSGEPTAIFPTVRLERRHVTTRADGWLDVEVPIQELSPDGEPFDRILFKASRPPSGGWAELDRVALIGQREASAWRTPVNAPIVGPPRAARFTIDCDAEAKPISPMIYGIAFSARHAAKDTWVWELGATARRWGGNPTSRFNWRLGNAWNTASDWYFMNVNPTGDDRFHWSRFLDENRDHGVDTALTVPMLGWVAKDTSSYSFPIAKHGGQEAVEPSHPDVGNGRSVDGELIKADPKRTSIEVGPSFVGEWVEAIRAGDKAKGERRVQLYFLDNEPMLWSSTHRDVHPDPVGYDELLSRTLEYGSAVRRADPDAKIAGPSSWGWPAYFYSAKDTEAGTWLRPDRRKHGDVPLLAWYLQKLREHEKRTKERLLDVLDVHFYPQGEGVYSERSDPRTAALRLRSTRALWDWSYDDESWIGEPIALLPRMQKLIDENYPGLGLSIGEYSFGGERHMSGALALAEALGRFGEHGVTAAFYWTYPKKDSPAFWAFRAYRNYDGKGGRFLDYSLPTSDAEGASLFASRDADSSRMVAIAVNFERSTPLDAALALEGCRDVAEVRLYTLSERRPGLVRGEAKAEGAKVTATLPPYSVSVVEVRTKRPVNR